MLIVNSIVAAFLTESAEELASIRPDDRSLELVSSLLKTEAEDLRKVLSSRKISVGREVFEKQMTQEQVRLKLICRKPLDICFPPPSLIA